MQVELNRSDLYWIGLKKILTYYLFALSLFFITRVVFLFYFSESSFIKENLSGIALSFVYGFRYDTIVLSYLMLVPIILTMTLSFFKNRKFFNGLIIFQRLYFTLGTLLIITFQVADLGFYSFYQDHLNVLFFGLLEDDTEAILMTIWKNYPVFIILIALITVILGIYKILKKIFKRIKNDTRGLFTRGPFKYLFFIFLTFVALIGGLRGGYSWYVLSPQYSDFSDKQFINQLSINSFISFDLALRNRLEANSKNFKMFKSMGFNSIDGALRNFLSLTSENLMNKDMGVENLKGIDSKSFLEILEQKTPVELSLEKNPPHVIFLLAESFGGFWIEHNSEDFNFLGELKEHFREDYYFPYFLSSDNGTISSLINIQTSMVTRPGKRYLNQSKYMRTLIESSVNLPYQRKGYEASFVYGGKLSWREIGNYFKYQKYDNIIGENRIKKELNLKGVVGTEWGLFDEHIYSFVRKKIENSNKPQFIFILSTSNHPPFENPKSYNAPSITIPSSLKDKITREYELFNARFKAFRYANDQTSSFIDWIKKEDRNIVFALTGDHNFFSFRNYDIVDKFSMYRVPFYVYLPIPLRKEDIDLTRFGSHEDIFATLIPLTLSDVNYTSFGENLFKQKDSHTSMLGSSINAKLLASEEGAIFEKNFYCWSDLSKGPRLITRDCKKSKLFELSKFYRAKVSVIDHYIDIMYQINQTDRPSVLGSDQQSQP